MSKKITFLFLLQIISYSCKPQVTPSEGSKLNYRVIGFSFPPGNTAGSYKIDIAGGNFSNEDSFARHVIISLNSDSNKIIGEVPAFDCDYTWRVKYASSKPKNNYSRLYHFSTLACDYIDTDVTRVRIVKKAKNCNGCYFFLDGAKALYDMAGNPVWFLPDIDSMKIGKTEVRDIKLTPFGTITFILPEKIYETDYAGNILWRGPGNNVRGPDRLHYHHEFTRLANGHYMVEGGEIRDAIARRPDPAIRDLYLFSDPAETQTTNRSYTYSESFRVFFATLMEYDEKGNVVWSYHATKYFYGSQFWLKTEAAGIPGLDFHDNGFLFDEQNKTIYLSYRDVGQIVKLSYPQGDVMNVYGNVYKPGLPQQDLSFCWQHCMRLSQKGYLYLFNNNFCHPGIPPSIMYFREPANGGDSLEKIWEFPCTEDGNDTTSGANYYSGGSVQELPDGSVFTNMGNYYSKLFIVSKSKEILWSAVAETKDEKTGIWKTLPSSYRATMISKKDLEQLIWNSK